MQLIRELLQRIARPRVPAALLVVVLLVMTVTWGYAWRQRSASDVPTAPPGYTLVSVYPGIPYPGIDEGWYCQNVGSTNSPYYGQDPYCLVRDGAAGVASTATPAKAVDGTQGGFEKSMAFVTAISALIAGLGAVGVRWRRPVPQGSAEPTRNSPSRKLRLRTLTSGGETRHWVPSLHRDITRDHSSAG
jgi:hypothetical protein